MKSRFIFSASILLFVAVASAQFFPFPGHGGIGSPDPDHAPKDPFVKEDSPVSACVLEFGGKTWNLHDPVGNHEKAYELLALTPAGRRLLESFRAQDRRTPHEYVHLNYWTRRNNGFPARVGAVYVYTDQKRQLFYDPNDDLGLVAIFMAHELMHATDSEVPLAYHEEVEARKNLPHDDYMAIRHRNSFRIERRGFDSQDRVMPELLSLSPCYESFIAEHRQINGLKLFNPTPDSFIRDAYGIPGN